MPESDSHPIQIGSEAYWSEAGRMIHAHRPVSGPDPFGQNLRQSARTDQIGSALVLHNMIRDIFERAINTQSESGKLV